MLTKTFFGKYLTLGFLFLSLCAFEESDCKEINASIEVFDAKQDGQNGSVKIDFKGQSSSSFVTSLVCPKKYFKKDILTYEVTELKKGIYTLVLVGKNERDNFCPKHFEFTVK